MELTEEQKKFLTENQGDLPKNYRIATIAQEMARSGDLPIDLNDIAICTLVFGTGEKHPETVIDGVSIYSKEYGPWDDRAKQINARRGELSIDMARRGGIDLNLEQQETVLALSHGKTTNLAALLIKCAQTYVAIQQPRWSRGEKKEPARDFEEAETILREEIGYMIDREEIGDEKAEELIDTVLSAFKARISQKKVEIENSLSTTEMMADRYLEINGYLQENGTFKYFGEAQLLLTFNRIKDKLPPDRFEEMIEELKGPIEANDGLILEGKKLEILRKYERLIEQRDKAEQTNATPEDHDL